MHCAIVDDDGEPLEW